MYIYSFSNITSKHGDVFLWNPCNPFSYPTGKTTSACGNVAVCMRPPFASPDVMYSLGKQNTATFTKDKGGVHLSYVSTQGGHSYAANIILRCNQTLQNSVLDGDTVPPYVTNTTSIYNFILTSKHACYFSPGTESSPSTSTSTTKTSTNSSNTTGSTGTTMHTTNSPSRNAATSAINNVQNFVFLYLTLLSMVSTLA